MTPATAEVNVRISDFEEVKELLDKATAIVEFAEWCTDWYDDEGVPPTYEEIMLRADVALGRRDREDLRRLGFGPIRGRG